MLSFFIDVAALQRTDNFPVNVVGHDIADAVLDSGLAQLAFGDHILTLEEMIDRVIDRTRGRRFRDLLRGICLSAHFLQSAAPSPVRSGGCCQSSSQLVARIDRYLLLSRNGFAPILCLPTASVTPCSADSFGLDLDFAPL